MRFGLFGGAREKGGGEISDSTLGYREFTDYVNAAEALGFHSVFIVEHHFTGVGQVSASLNHLTYIAARTSKIRLGTAVLVLPWHNPVLLAEQVATLDLLSDGRLDFGVGKGYRGNEFKGFCIAQEEAGERFEETLELLRKCWTSAQPFSWHSKRWNFEDIVVEPSCTQRPHPPLWLGASSMESICKAGAAGFNLLLDQYGTIKLTAERVAAYRKAVAEAGREFNPMSVGVTRALQITDTAEEAEAALELRAKMLSKLNQLTNGGSDRAAPKTGLAAFSDSDAVSPECVLIGNSGQIIERLRRMEALGVEYVLLAEASGSVRALERFAKEIMPAFRKHPQTAPSVAAEPPTA
jgi:alkanesulfonate monooxygenase SsuD/methylene tetrahydromethanopterin reductase-like flavin-dependent oxidoreductase (luciferase family)